MKDLGSKEVAEKYGKMVRYFDQLEEEKIGGGVQRRRFGRLELIEAEEFKTLFGK
jgi:hypothetical protein